MQVTVEVPDEYLREAAEAALRFAFQKGQQYEQPFAVLTVQKQIKAWVADQDFTPYIEKHAPGVLREVVRDTLFTSLKTAIRAEIKALQDSGQLALITRQTLTGE